jgi:hypothetical protein
MLSADSYRTDLSELALGDVLDQLRVGRGVFDGES